MKARPEPLPWSEAVRDRTAPERGRFLESHVELVRYLALRISNRLPASVEMDDLVHDGILGLLDATERYDPSRGVRFRTYAETRIRGAILDGLRQKDWRPRSLRQRQRNLEVTLRELSSTHHRAATEEEIAAALELDPEDYRALLAELNRGTQLPLDELRAESDFPSRGATMPHQPLERKELAEALAEEISLLPERERRVLELYYVEELNMKEAGAVLGVTESRVCQLHAQAAARLRGALDSRLHAATTAIAGGARK